MKKASLFILMLLFAYPVTAQNNDYNLIIELNSGTSISLDCDEIKDLYFTEKTEPPLIVETFTAKNVSFKMVKIIGGTFNMGEVGVATPVHQVTLSDYYIGQTEVTQELWYAVMGQKPTTDLYQWSSNYGLGDDYPVYYVSWNDCQEFITKLNALTGKSFRLPTEAEWEYAARGGNKSKGCIYSGSSTIGDVAWYGDNSNLSTHIVATKIHNELGLYDMTGNVWEYCSDLKGNYSSEAQTNPTGATTGSYRICRGGSFDLNAKTNQVTFRHWFSPDGRGGSNMGLRLALSD